MAITGAQIRAAVNTWCNRSVAADGLNDEMTTAIRRIARMALWPVLHETDASTLAFTAGLKLKAMPSDFEIRGLDRVYVSGDRTLAEAPADDLRARQELPGASTGDPQEFAIIGGDLYVYPIPSASVTLKLDHWATPAAATESTLVFGDEFKEAIICATIVAYLNDDTGLGTHPKVAEAEAKFQIEMATLLDGADIRPCIARPFRYA